ncbi:SpoIIE family protein phosphatase [Streptantibioticus rubrisoli]|uniref:SpoIIE family protein phosphatase n=1 Tax=Streptantibioticus rubrisoli TaxID=1387313 RepID=A0ABT1P631_9ACTN|nr:SpoIIE family protein phosphatase [Streptantibioticus rubrisoli]MCQ4040837.1 SpoIIE family protein phosphatase [Streptantibioticus rubrisoli]
MDAFDRTTTPEGVEPPFDLMGVAIGVVDAKGLVVSWSVSAQAVLGYPAAEVVRRPVTRLLVNAEDGARVLASVRGRPTSEGWAGLVDVRHRDGRPLRLGLWIWPLDPPLGWLLAAIDIGRTPWWEVNRSMLERFLSSSPVGMAVMSPDLRFVWINDALERTGGVSRQERIGKRFGEVLPRLDAEKIEAQMRQVLDTGQPATDFEYRGRTPADPNREHAYSTSFFRLDDAFGRVLGVCYMVVDVTERVRARERLALLNEAGARTGSTLDVGRTAQELAEIGVPRLADFVTVDLLDTVLRGDAPRAGPLLDVRELRRAGQKSVLEGSPESIAGTGDIVTIDPDSPWGRCLADGTSFLETRPDTGPGGWMAADAVRSASFRRFGLRSLMLIPIRARGNVLGVATFVRWQRPDPFEQDDLLLAEEVVARAAVNIDNARRFTREHSTALALQRDLLPHKLTTRTTLEVASRYLPAGASGGVGGDWFDVIPLSGARTALVVGDLVGHGISAAASMGRFRTAVRTLADMDLPPDELLAHLDDLVLPPGGEEPREEAHPEPGVGATCLYVVYDPVTRNCAMARAGHPPPAIVAPDGSVSFPDLPTGPRLGMGGMPFQSAEFELAEGSLLALFTDGLLEAGGRDEAQGLDRLRTVLAHPHRPLEQTCGAVLDALLAGPPDDDVALLIARTHALGPDHVASWQLPCDPAVVSEARVLASRCLEGWGLEDLVFTAEVIVSELVTNAIRHASGPMQLRLIRQHALICEVADSSSTSPRLRHARTTDEGGRGLFLVAQLSRRWGTRYTPDGKIIWAELSRNAA